jgi:hypothetical protein
MTDHPITPPPELVQRLCDSAALSRSFKHISIREVDVLLILEAFQAGADQELEACCTWLSDHGYIAADPELRDARRSKALSLKEQALAELAATERCHPADYSTIRKALEALPND